MEKRKKVIKIYRFKKIKYIFFNIFKFFLFFSLDTEKENMFGPIKLSMKEIGLKIDSKKK
jgi:hypothetical protein